MSERTTNPVRRFYTSKHPFGSKPNMRQAIHAKCAECVGCTSDLQGRGFSERVEEGYMDAIGCCEITSCPLWGYRPYQSRQVRAERVAMSAWSPNGDDPWYEINRQAEKAV